MKPPTLAPLQQSPLSRLKIYDPASSLFILAQEATLQALPTDRFLPTGYAKSKYRALHIPERLLLRVDILETPSQSKWQRCVLRRVCEHLFQPFARSRRGRLDALSGLEGRDHDEGKLVVFLGGLDIAVFVDRVGRAVDLEELGFLVLEDADAVVAMVGQERYGWAAVFEPGGVS